MSKVIRMSKASAMGGFNLFWGLAASPWSCVLDVSLTLQSFLFSGFLATNIFQRLDLESIIQIASLTIFVGALTTAAQSAFTD